MRTPPSQRGAQLEAQPAVDAVADRAARVEQRAGRRDARRSAARQAGVSWPPSRSARLAPDACQTSAGTYEPPALPVDGQVLPEVGQLQRRAQRVGTLDRDVLAPVAGEAQHQPADRVRRSAAVVEHVRPRRVARGGDVLAERAQQIVEQLDRQVELLTGVGQRGEHRVTRRRVQPRLPASSRRAARRRVGPARRRCRRRCARRHRWRRRAGASCGQQPRRDRKVLVVRAAAIVAGTPHRRSAHHSVSGAPARWLAARAITNSRSDRRLR